MLYLLLSILFSTSLVVILRMFARWQVRTEHGIVFNYLICCLTGLLSMRDYPDSGTLLQWDGWWICLILGLGFILVFVLIGKSTHSLGVATTSIAFKLSFVIPVLVAVLFYGDKLSAIKIIGILMAVTAVWFITQQPKAEDTADHEAPSKLAWLLPFMIFFGSGITDSTFNFIQRNYTPEGFDHIVSISVFAGAFISGMLLYGRNKDMYQKKNILAGILLGVPNYFSLYFLLMALKHTGYTPATLFPLNNLGIVGLSALAGLFLFKEPFTLKKTIGFLLAVASILLIGFWG